MSDLKFADTHNLVAFLSKPTESEGFEQIVNFLNANPIKYALTVNPTIYTSCIKQFWDIVKVKTVNGEVQLQALVDKKKVIITESIIRRDLQLEDAEGTDCLPNATIFEQLSHMGEGKGFSGRVTPLFPTMMVHAHEEIGECSEIPTDPHHTPTITQPSSSQPYRKQKSRKSKKKNIEVPQPSGSTGDVPDENVPTTSNDPLLSGKDRLKLTKLKDLCTNLQKKVLDLEKAKTAQDSEIASLKKRVKKLERRNKSRTPWLKRLRKVGEELADIDADVEVTLIDETQGRNDDNLMFNTCVLDEKEVKVEKVVSTTEVTTDSAITTADKGKAKITEPEKPLKKKDQIMYDQEVALNLQAQLQAELEEEERLARQKEEEANIALIESWDNTQAMMDADRLLAERLQAREQEELTDEEKASLVRTRSKKQKIDDYQEEAEMKKLIEVVPNKEEVAIDDIPLVTKPPSMVDWKIIKEGKLGYYQIIRADGSSKRYSSMIQMLRDFSREDWKLYGNW
ncbi:hypothetical protein Tco_0173045 [Tanacetum coccineum]